MRRSAAAVTGSLGRVLYLVAGTLALVLAAIGVVLPLVPTTPFVLVAAACFARSSPRLYTWLVGNRLFGPLIVEWREHRHIPLRARIVATTMIVAFGTFAIVVVAPSRWVRYALIATFCTVITWLWVQHRFDRSARGSD